MLNKSSLLPHIHYKDCTREEISNYLEAVKSSITNGQYTISKREKNQVFFDEYNISSERAKSILLSLTYKNFCWYQLDERNESDVLYIFRVDKKLCTFDELKDVVIFIKINYLDEEQFTIVISFHESEKPEELEYCFKED